ncbi:MAG: hypothetical protein AAGA31_21225, partial [Bacteroidota bacterium]
MPLDTLGFSLSRYAYSQYIKGITYDGLTSMKLASTSGEKAVANLKIALEQGDSLYTEYEYGYMLEFAGRMAYQNGDFPLAYYRLSQVDELLKTAYVARTEVHSKMTRGSALMFEGKLEEAISIFQQILEHPLSKQSIVDALVARANLYSAYAKAGRYEEAEDINKNLAADFEELLAITGNP